MNKRLHKLSVVIVNYNVRYFLEQTIQSAQASIAYMQSQNPAFTADIWVVDNDSVDGSVEMVKEKFPEVHLIDNKKNVGFSKANNQAIRLSKGEYVLLLNPDTVVEESTFYKCISFMDEHPKAGGLGVKMIDGKGQFLPESKRGLPTPMVAFFKIFGFSALFPNSKTFGRYHLTYLSEDETHEVDILSGAFMWMRRETLDKVGLLDETFFMYGEDIDLSYRIILGGYQNYYFSDTQIIHYKGESTKKGSVNYVFVFYRAMIIFARKHFSNKYAGIYSFGIHTAIYLRASLAVLDRFVKKSILPVADGLLIYGAWLTLTKMWGEVRGIDYPSTFTQVILPIYTLIALLGMKIGGGYRKPYKPALLMGGMGFIFVALTFFYAFLPELHRYSRTLMFLGSVFAFGIFTLNRMLAHKVQYGSFKLTQVLFKKILIVGSVKEASRVENLLKKSGVPMQIQGMVAVDEAQRSQNPKAFLGSLERLSDLIQVHGVNEVVFCAKDVPAETTIALMTAFKDEEVEFKIAPEKSQFIIGSSSKNAQGDFYTIDIQLAIQQDHHRWNKRFFDVISALSLLLTFPLHFWWIEHKKGFFKNIFKVLFGLKSWVGYAGNQPPYGLPKIKKGVLSPIDGQVQQDETSEATVKRVNLLYAKDYSLSKDFGLLWQNFELLGKP